MTDSLESNLEKAEDHLKRFADRPLGHFIRWHEPCLYFGGTLRKPVSGRWAAAW